MRKREKEAGYHGCSFGAPPPRPPLAQVEREKLAFTQLREIDELRRDIECGKCHERGHVTKDCPMTRREQRFDSSGGILKQQNIAGTFASAPPVTERMQARIQRATPDLSAVTSRFREWEKRESLPMSGAPSSLNGRGSRSRTPTQPPVRMAVDLPQPAVQPQPLQERTDLNSPKRKQNVIKRLQSENKKLQDAIQHMKTKMIHLEEVSSYTARSSAPGKAPVVASADPQVNRETVSPPRSNSRSGGRVSPARHVPEPHGAKSRSLSVPRRSVAEIPVPRRQKVPPRIRAPAPTYADWQQMRAGSSAGLRSNSAHADNRTGSVGPVVQQRSVSVDRCSTRGDFQYQEVLTVTTSVPRGRSTHRGSLPPRPSGGSDVMSTDDLLNAATAPTLEARIQTLEAIQKDVRAALGHDPQPMQQFTGQPGIPTIPMNVHELRAGHMAMPNGAQTERSSNATDPAMKRGSHARVNDVVRSSSRAKERAAIINVMRPRWM
eukprot:TRINITY_DN33626_c0_g1_i1.p1 TRINITY_DN33626_c0_g1~~TRINITY_DN33626_c0_g1_i1.p1  ORF type:complete len:537 (+),score=135.52 TRINITY_DN33626_c0_g1_i1:138-1613(+)